MKNQFLENDIRNQTFIGMWQNYFKNRNSHAKEINEKTQILVFLAATYSEIIIIQILHGIGQIKDLDRIVIVRTGTYL